MFTLRFKSVFKWDIDVYIVDTGVNLDDFIQPFDRV